MIQVQIASSLQAQGLGGARWVLVDPSEGPAVAAAAAAPGAPAGQPPLPQPPVPGARIRRTSLALQVACAVVLVSALTAAWWVAARMADSRGGGSSSIVQAGTKPG